MLNNSTQTLSKCLSIVSATGMLLGAMAAQAGTVDCLAVTDAKVTHTQGCEKSISATQDFLNKNPMTVNAENFFGFNDWTFIQKDESFSSSQSGAWNIGADQWSQYSDLMVIFKSGNGTTLIGYELEQNATTGNWVSPFSYPEFSSSWFSKHPNASKDVSHLSYYGRGEVITEIDVPESTSLGLLCLGLAGVFMTRRQNKKA